MNVETISYCNLNCKFCKYDERKDNGIMTMGNGGWVVTQLINYGIKHIHLTPMAGEIFLDPFLMDRLEILERTNITYEFFTNFTVNFIPEILNFKNLKKINISINGHDRESFKELTNSNDYYYDELLKNLKILQEIKTDKQIHFQIKDRYVDFTWINRVFSEMWQHTLIRGATMSRVTEIDNWANKLDFKDSELLKLRKYERTKPCDVLRHQNIILWNGAVGACGCRDINHELTIGSIFNSSLEEMYSSDTYRNMLKEIPELCKNCTSGWGYDE